MTESAPRVLAAKAAPRADRRFAYRLAVKIGVPAALVLYVVYCQSQPPTQ